MRPIVIFATLLAIACDTPPVEGPPGPAGPAGPQGAVGPAGPPGGSTVKSGTRLKARVARSEDGASQFLGWWDSELGTRCERKEGALTDGEWHDYRCLPADNSPYVVDSVFRADPTCSVKATTVNPRTVFCYDWDWDSWEYVFFRIGRPVETLFELKDGVCVESERASDGWRACGDEPPLLLEDFVAMPEILEP